jgi:glycine dehydrogenase subunit 1
MPYVQHTPAEQEEMLRTIGVRRMEDLFTTIPEAIRLGRRLDLPAGESEYEVLRDLAGLGAANRPAVA